MADVIAGKNLRVTLADWLSTAKDLLGSQLQVTF